MYDYRYDGKIDDTESGIRTCKIMVMGVGGAGNNAVNRMIDMDVKNTKFVSVNTDKQDLDSSKVPPQNRIIIGKQLTRGLGAGANPEIGARAAEESKEEIKRILEGVDLLFITAGMGGGTGTGATPVIAKIAKEMGCLTVAVVTKPFEFEGWKRVQNTTKGIANLKKYVDTIVIVPNEKLLETLEQNVTVEKAFSIADETLRQGILGIANLISNTSTINLDFADIKAILQNQGVAHMGVGRATGENRIMEATKKAIDSPLLETSIEGATSVILNVSGGKDMTLSQMSSIAKIINETIGDPTANIIFGTNVNPEFNGEIEVTVIATGFNKRPQTGERIYKPTPQEIQPPIQEVTPKEEVAEPKTVANYAPKEMQNPKPIKTDDLQNRRPEDFEEVEKPINQPKTVESQPKTVEKQQPQPPKQDGKDTMPAFMRKFFGKK